MQGFITSRGYRAAKTRVVSARQLWDELLVLEVARLHAENYGVCGRKMHALLKRQGWDIGRDQTERLMRLAGVRGVRKSKKAFTTRPYKTELIRQRGPWRTVEQVELATLEWVWWWNHQRLHGTMKQRAADILAFFDRPGTSNGPTEAIDGRLEHLRGSALGFRNLTNYIARSLLEAGGFKPALHPRS